MATCFGGVGNTLVDNHNTQEVDNVSKNESQDEDLLRWLLCKTVDLKQFVEDKNNEPREAIHEIEQRLNDLTLALHCQNTPIENVLDRYTETLCTAQKKTSLESYLLQDIPILNGQDSSQLEDWLTDIETASELTNESRTKLAQAKSRGLVRTLITKALIAQKTWEEIKDSSISKYQMQTFTLQSANLWAFSKLTRNHWQHMSIGLNGKLTDASLTMMLLP